jgi:hypothetical protein
LILPIAQAEACVGPADPAAFRGVTT